MYESESAMERILKNLKEGLLTYGLYGYYTRITYYIKAIVCKNNTFFGINADKAKRPRKIPTLFCI
jgi:hypothetical protein